MRTLIHAEFFFITKSSLKYVGLFKFEKIAVRENKICAKISFDETDFKGEEVGRQRNKRNFWVYCAAKSCYVHNFVNLVEINQGCTSLCQQIMFYLLLDN